VVREHAATRCVPDEGAEVRRRDADEPGEMGDPDAVRRVLTVGWAGDVATLEVDGQVVADRFWDGTPWHVDLDAIDATPWRTVTLRLLPLHPDAPVRLDEGAAARRAATSGPLCALDGITVEQSVRWRERS
jgi:hypothetical protein